MRGLVLGHLFRAGYPGGPRSSLSDKIRLQAPKVPFTLTIGNVQYIRPIPAEKHGVALVQGTAFRRQWHAHDRELKKEVVFTAFEPALLSFLRFPIFPPFAATYFTPRRLASPLRQVYLVESSGAAQTPLLQSRQ